MEIEIQLLSFLRHYLPKGSRGFTCKMQLNEAMTVADVFQKLHIPDEVTQKIMVIMVDGTNATEEQVLSDGDVLTVIPIAAGG